LADEELSSKAKDHQLKENWVGYRELYISGDLLLVYKITENTLTLVRIGSHSEIFR